MIFHRLAQDAELSEQAGTFFLGNFLTGDFDAFAEIDEMGGGEKPATLAAGTGDAVDHGARAALAIRPGDVDDLHAVGGVGEELLEQAARSVESEFDPEHLGGEQPINRLAVVHGRANSSLGISLLPSE